MLGLLFVPVPVPDIYSTKVRRTMDRTYLYSTVKYINTEQQCAFSYDRITCDYYYIIKKT